MGILDKCGEIQALLLKDVQMCKMGIKGIVHPKIKNCWKYTPLQVIQDVDEFVSSSDLEKCSITSLAHQWILCSEWVPSEWESKQLIKTSQ